MPQNIQNVLQQYVQEIIKIYGSHLKRIILYGSYARGDFREDSDVDIMILLDLTDIESKAYFDQLINITFDFNMEYGVDIKPIAKSSEHFWKWVNTYPFYTNISKEGVMLYDAA